MEEELRHLHREVRAIFLYVTHDQREALALSDRIVVFNKGRIDQVGTPSEIYCAPSSVFTAQFVGNANVIPVEILRIENSEATVRLVSQTLKVRIAGTALYPGTASMVVRPEALRLRLANDEPSNGVGGIIQDFAFRGSGHAYRVAVSGLAETLKAEVAAENAQIFPIGSKVWLSWDPHAPLLLQSKRNLGSLHEH
jgi:ABC-type Fe3+/spermidine/putrescine transport system ATPase subunit